MVVSPSGLILVQLIHGSQQIVPIEEDDGISTPMRLLCALLLREAYHLPFHTRTGHFGAEIDEGHSALATLLHFLQTRSLIGTLSLATSAEADRWRDQSCVCRSIIVSGRNYIWPLSKSIQRDKMNTSFGPRIHKDKWDFHDGIDLPAKKGTRVHAMRNGIVHSAGHRDTHFSSRHAQPIYYLGRTGVVLIRVC